MSVPMTFLDQMPRFAFFTGKGGVGKTSLACATATRLADGGAHVLLVSTDPASNVAQVLELSTTDPAAHLDQVLDGASEDNLTVSRIDPHAATAAYRDRVLATKGSRLDDAGRARLTEDLLSPCTEEVAVFGEFSHLVSKARRQFVVIDTAPTGHTLLLMDATGSYHRDIVRGMADAAGVVTPLMRLQDPELTRVIIVTLPEATPMQEAQDLQADLSRAGITPWAWVMNQSLSAADTQDPLLSACARAEAPYLSLVRDLSSRVAVIPMLAHDPTGPEALRAMGRASVAIS